MQTDTKFKSLVHYICSRRAHDPQSLGAVKLNKILWLADVSSYYETGKPVTESRYIKQDFGPVPARIGPALRALQKEGFISVREAEHFGRQKKEYVVHLPIEPWFLTPSEQQIVDSVIDHVCDEHTATSVSEATHNHIWKAAENGEELPLFTVFAKPGMITEAERMWARMKLAS